MARDTRRYPDTDNIGAIDDEDYPNQTQNQQRGVPSSRGPVSLSQASSVNSIWMVPPIISHDPQSPLSEPEQTTKPPLPPGHSSQSQSSHAKNPDSGNHFLSRLSNLIKKGPPQKPHMPHRAPSTQISYENPVYGTRDDVFPSSSKSLSQSNAATGTNRTPSMNNQGVLLAEAAGRQSKNNSTDLLQSDDDEIAGEKNNNSNNDGANNAKKDESGGGAHANDENKERGNWGSHVEFVLSCIGYAVGLGNVWRFPYLCYKNGGGIFLVIYWILSLTVGLPIIFLELSLGQFTSQGPTGVWNYAPIVKGLGYSMCAISSIGAIYYNVIISWALYYLFASFRSQLLWSECDYTSWADYRCEMQKTDCLGFAQLRASDGLCYTLDPFMKANLPSPRYISTYCRNTAIPVKSTGRQSVVPCFYLVDEIPRNRSTVVGCWDEYLAFEQHRGPQFSTEQFYFRNVLGQDGKALSGFSAVSLGPPQKWLVLCLLLAWILVFLSLLNGIKSSGKVVYFTAVFPYVVLAVLIGKGVTLPGAMDGIMYFLTPDFEKMKDPNVWYAAASQLFFSLSACWGGMMALSSYNKFHTNTLRDSLIVTAADTLTSFIASFAIFSVIGYGAHILNKPVDEVADAGTGLAFILYPKIIDSLPGSVAWAILFFFMLLLLGLDSEFNSLETIFTALLDKYPNLRSNLKRKALAFGLFCIPFFLLGIPLVCPGGTQLLELIDDYGAGWGVFLIGIIETLSVAWIYGTPRFVKDLSAMMPFLLKGKTRARVVPWILRLYWGVLTPFMLIFILFYSWTKYEPRPIVGEEVLGWYVTIFVVMWMPVMAIWVVVSEWRRHHSFRLGLKAALSPSPKWGPFLDEHRREVAAIHGDLITAVLSSAHGSLDCVIDEPKDENNNNNNNNNYNNNTSGQSGGNVNNSFVAVDQASLTSSSGANSVYVVAGSNSRLGAYSSNNNNYYPSSHSSSSNHNIALTITSPNASPALPFNAKPISFQNIPYVVGNKSSSPSVSSRSTAL